MRIRAHACAIPDTVAFQDEWVKEAVDEADNAKSELVELLFKLLKSFNIIAAVMPRIKEITDDTRIIDLTVGELMDVLVERLSRVLTQHEEGRAEPEALVDTWDAAQLLGIVAKSDPGPEPTKASPAWKVWRETKQALRDDVAHRFQQLLLRRPELASLARYDGRRRYFVRADLLRYLDSLGSPRRRRR